MLLNTAKLTRILYTRFGIKSIPCHWGQSVAESHKMQISFRTDEGLETQIKTRDKYQSPHNAARVHLERYFSCLAYALREIRDVFTLAEFQMMSDAANGTLWEVHSVKMMAAQLQDAASFDGLDKKWGVDVGALIHKLKPLTHFQHMALVDALERFWADPNRDTTLEYYGSLGLGVKK